MDFLLQICGIYIQIWMCFNFPLLNILIISNAVVLSRSVDELNFAALIMEYPLNY